MNHRESWAEERIAPSREEWAKTLSGEDKPTRKRTPKEADAASESKPVDTSPARVILRRSKSE